MARKRKHLLRSKAAKRRRTLYLEAVLKGALRRGRARYLYSLKSKAEKTRAKHRHRLLQTKSAKHRRRLYALRAKELFILRKRIRHQPVTLSEYNFLKSRRKAHRRIYRQKAAKRKVRAYLQVTFVERVKGAKSHRAKKTRSRKGRIYRTDIDRGNYVVRTFTEYYTLNKEDLSNGDLSGRFRARIEAYQNRFNAAENFKTMSASLQLFTGKIVNPYTGLIARPASITVHARMRSVKRRADTHELDEMDFSQQLTDFENMVDYMEEIGFLNYSEAEDE